MTVHNPIGSKRFFIKTLLIWKTLYHPKVHIAPESLRHLKDQIVPILVSWEGVQITWNGHAVAWSHPSLDEWAMSLLCFFFVDVLGSSQSGYVFFKGNGSEKALDILYTNLDPNVVIVCWLLMISYHAFPRLSHFDMISWAKKTSRSFFVSSSSKVLPMLSTGSSCERRVHDMVSTPICPTYSPEINTELWTSVGGAISAFCVPCW